MKTFFSNYNKRWWIYGTLLGGIASAATFIVHGEIIAFRSSLDSGPLLSFELLLIIGICSVIALVYIPIFFISDFLFKKSNVALSVTMLCTSIFTSTLMLLKKHFTLSPDLLYRGWNAYLYTLVMGALCLFGWIRSRTKSNNH